MSTKPTNPKNIVEQLQNEGLSASLENGCLVVRDVSYLDESGTVCEDGFLTDTYPHTDHTFRFSGIPHTKDGRELHVASRVSDPWNGFDVKSHLSFKKSEGKNTVDYVDQFEKVTYYIHVIEAHAKAVNPGIRGARRHRPINASKKDEIPFWYQDLNSSRAGVHHVNEKIKGQKVAIIGLGGTGSYVLDLVAKSYVQEIHLYDDDSFQTHNAFRAPGAVEEDVLNNELKKVIFLGNIYSRLHKGIKIHDYRASTKVIAEEFKDIDFVFICMDGNEQKKAILKRLVEMGIPFVDCGMGVEEVEGSLTGTIRVTTVTREKNDHIDRRISSGGDRNDEYGSKNIQIAELNALNAALAVIKWKRIFGFYHDHGVEYSSTYMFNCNSLSNDEKN